MSEAGTVGFFQVAAYRQTVAMHTRAVDGMGPLDPLGIIILKPSMREGAGAFVLRVGRPVIVDRAPSAKLHARTGASQHVFLVLLDRVRVRAPRIIMRAHLPRRLVIKQPPKIGQTGR